MSCLCPISIPDKVLSRFGVKNSSLLVPCGHCSECARDKRNDWFVRLWSVYKRCSEQGIRVWFLTVTVNQHLWPHLTLSSSDVGDRISPFMRSWCERFRYLNGGVMPVRFLCSEFGSEGREYTDKHGVQRVTTGALHFHGLIFEARAVGNRYVPLEMDIASICRGLELTHGYVDYSLIKGPECIRYTVKYATKDFSIDDYKLRARVFCSPGIGDPTFYFGDSPATPTVLINGFHYRTPRYFVEKQWVALYTRDGLFDEFGHNVLVAQRARRRLSEFLRIDEFMHSMLRCDNSLRDYLINNHERNIRRPARLDQVLDLMDLGFTGPSHPLLRYYQKIIADFDFNSLIVSDVSFIWKKPFKNTYLRYERSQAFVPLSLDFTS